MTDNQWAAEWLGKGAMNSGLWPVFDEAGWLMEWQPDKNLNQFKLVLDKFEEWRAEKYEAVSVRCKSAAFPPIPRPQPALKAIADSVGSVVQVVHGYEQTMNILRACAFTDASIALKAIREAVENDQ